MKTRGKWAERLAEQADLQGECFPGQSLVELYGDRRLLIERHRGIIQYGTNEIHIQLKFGTISVCGQRLELARMCRNQLIITGQIDTIHITRG